MTLNIDDRKNFYCKIFAQAFSPDGKYLSVADRYGRISVFNLSASLRTNIDDKIKKYCFQFQVKPCPIYSLLTKENHLICGCADGTAVGYLWSDLEKQKAKAVFILNDFSSVDPNNPFEINAILNSPDVDNTSSRIYTAGGDSNINLWDLETKKVISSFSGHSDYVHCLTFWRSNAIISGSEDGTVRFWDVRTGGSIHVLDPSKSECARVTRGKWIGCVATDGDWMATGGGPSLGFWHLGSYSLVKSLETSDVDHHAVLFHEDRIIGAGDKYSLYHWNFKGDLITNVPVSALISYDIKLNEFSNKHKVLCSCGTGSKINVFVNLGYTAFTLDVSN